MLLFCPMLLKKALAKVLSNKAFRGEVRFPANSLEKIVSPVNTIGEKGCSVFA